jgi:anti-sigma regulatory factor (Ser/Thr protein kinase)
MRIRGGVDAPSRARRLVLSRLDGEIGPTTASDVALVVSELVTNSVVHADVGPRKTLTVELVRLDDRVRITVIDPGSRVEPRVLPPDDERLGGFGLFLVRKLSDGWGVGRDRIGRSRVWCDILLDQSRSSVFRAMAGEPPSGSPG